MTDWVLYDISERKLSRNGDDEYFILSFFNTDTKTRAYTYITIGYRNNEWWGNTIINDEYGIYNFKTLKTKQNGSKLLINGDSIPQLKTIATQQEAKSLVDIMSG